MRSVLPRLAGKRGDGQESQRKMKDVRRFHVPKQPAPRTTILSHKLMPW